MRMKLLSLCLAVLLSVCSLPVFAVSDGTDMSFTDVTVTYERASGIVTIDGTAPFAANAEEPVRLLLLKPGTDIDELIAGAISFPEVGVHVDEAMLSGDKSFAFSPFVLPDTLEAGDYILRLAAEDSLYTKTIPVASVAQAIAAMNEITEAEIIWSNITKYNDVYLLDIEEGSAFDKLEEAGKDFVLQGMCNKTYADAAGVKNNFDAYMQLYRIYVGPWGILEGIVENYASILGLTDYMADFEALGTKQDAVYKALVGKTYQDVSAFAAAFEQAVAKAGKTDSGKSSGSSSNRGTGKPTAAVRVPADAQSSEETQNEMPTIPFTDLGSHAWAEASIIKLYQMGIINGKGSGIFAPNDLVTRAEAVKMIVLALSTVDREAQCDFSDVATDSWMYPYIATATKQGIINGYGDGTAGAVAPVTREDFATLILRACQASGKSMSAAETGHVFADHDVIAEYAVRAVEILQKAGVLNGADDGCFYPKNHTTRAEAAKVIAALLS